MMKVLAFDQSTRVTGYCLFNNGCYSDSGVIDLTDIDNTETRTQQMGLSICDKIEFYNPDFIIIEDVSMQKNPDVMKKLARLQGMILGFAVAHNIQINIIEPTKWRSALKYQQGRGIKRDELKKQSFDYVKKYFGFENFTEDRCEAICINEAAHKILLELNEEDI